MSFIPSTQPSFSYQIRLILYLNYLRRSYITSYSLTYKSKSFKIIKTLLILINSLLQSTQLLTTPLRKLIAIRIVLNKSCLLPLVQSNLVSQNCPHSLKEFLLSALPILNNRSSYKRTNAFTINRRDTIHLSAQRRNSLGTV